MYPSTIPPIRFGIKKYRTENIGSSESLCQRQSNRKCQHIDQNTGNKSKYYSQPERMAEGFIQKQFGIIGKSYKGYVLYSCKFAE